MKIRLLLLFALGILIHSCEKEIDTDIVEMTFREKLAAEFDQDKFTGIIPYDFEVDWTGYTESFSEELGSKFYEFGIRYTSDFNPISLGVDTEKKFTAMALEGEEGAMSFVIADFSGTAADQGSLQFSTIGDFTGSVVFYDGSSRISSLLYSDGELVGDLKEIKGKVLENFNTTGRIACEEAECVYEGGPSYIIITTTRITDWYNVRGDGSYEYNGSTRTTTHEYVYRNNNPSAFENFKRHSNYRSGGGSSSGGLAGTVSFEEKTLQKINNRSLSPPPSCKSFNFRSTGSNWQEASVINIRFNIVLIEIIAGVRVEKIIPISFEQPVKFGMPKNFANGTSIPSGLAAEIGARAINYSIDDVISKYNNLVVNSTDVIRSHFQERLKSNFREYSNGGRVNFNDMTSVSIASQYKTYGVIPDSCF